MALAPPTRLHDKAAQLVFVRLGSNMTPPVSATDDADRVAALLDAHAFGGVLLFNGHFPDTADQLAALQAQSRFPLLVATDMERGVGQQMDGATVFPHAMAFGALGEAAEAAVASFARAAAREALACGIHQAFAPVADINLHAQNPIISIRAFGTETAPVERLVRAYIQGAREEGLITTAKHFPGHGRTVGDTHATLPVVEASREALVATDLAPFRAAFDAGVDAVMTTHAAFPALDPAGGPATLSAPILRDLLRDEMGFAGPVVTDSMLMGAVRETHDSVAAQAVALVEAGVDCLLDVPDPKAAVEGLVAAVEDGTLPAARIEEACARVWRLKEQLADRFGPDVFTAPERYVPRTDVGRTAHRKLADSVAEQAVTVHEAPPGALPLDAHAAADDGGLLVLFVTPRPAGLSDVALQHAVRDAAPGVRYEAVDADTDDTTLKALVEAASRAERVIAVVSVTPAAWQKFGLSPAQERLIAQCIEQAPTVIAALGSPHVLAAFPDAQARLCTYSDVPAAQRALVRRLFA